jgi:hypothetical protein
MYVRMHVCVCARACVRAQLVGLERGPLSLVSTTGELLGRKSSGFGLEIREYGLGIRHADHMAPSIRNSWH